MYPIFVGSGASQLMLLCIITIAFYPYASVKHWLLGLCLYADNDKEVTPADKGKTDVELGGGRRGLGRKTLEGQRRRSMNELSKKAADKDAKHREVAEALWTYVRSIDYT